MFFNKNIHNNYKVKELKVFTSKEYLYKNRKNYRFVYDVRETAYIYCEFSFHNKLFDIKDWNTEVTLICHNRETKETLCNLKKDIEVLSTVPIVYVREGWGTPDPGWWVAGLYQWDVYVKDTYIESVSFYVMDVGLVTPTKNPYFDLNKIRLFESPKGGLDYFNRKYADAFLSSVQYINVELKLTNKCQNLAVFPLYFIFNCYKESGDLKAIFTYYLEIKDHRNSITLDTGYGSEAGNYWYAGDYRIEIIFMNTLIGTTYFKIVDKASDLLSASKNNTSPNNSKKHHTNLALTSKKQTTDQIEGRAQNLKKQPKNIIILPQQLQIPFLQYLTFFDEYINALENTVSQWTVQRHSLGLEWNIMGSLSITDTKRHLGNYLRILYQNDFTVETTSTDKTKLPFLMEQLTIQKGHFQQQIFLLQKEDITLSVDKKFLEKIIAKLHTPMEEKKIETISELRTLIIKDPKLVLEKLQQLQLNKENETALILLRSRFFLLQKSKNMNLMTEREYHVAQNKLIRNILSLIDTIYEE